ncbi:MAG: sugar phosphate isomerase/epimerase family protein [Armatimonadota bacterium]|nr:sugar phosphate isomerase/epimerase family protein [Armatimonadota bacterium]MDT7971802.1 sugar phosphate isomerase/epimerase family protein [Armatimonadota bacterium]
MQVTAEKLAKLTTEYAGYLEGDRLDAFFREFGIKFAAGHWCAGEFYDRFNPFGYNRHRPDFRDTIIDQIARVAQAGIEGIEFHDVLFLDANGQIDDAKIAEVKDALAHYKVTPTNMNINVWTDSRYRLGGVTNPDPAIRQRALEQCLQAVEIARRVGCSSVALWPGADGWDYNFEVNYGRQLDLFIEACVEINRKAMAAGLKFGTEAKPKEPREGNMLTSTTAKAALVAKEVNAICGGTNMGVAIDYGHEQMYGDEPAAQLYMLKRFGVPIVNFHLNDAKYRSNDEDRVAGTSDVWRLVDFCYAAIDVGYDGWFGEDQFTYRMEQVQAMRLSKEFFGNAMKKALLIYAHRDELEKARQSGDQAAVLHLIKRIIYTA